MAQRIVIPVMGNTLAPYNASLNMAAASEQWHVNVSQLGKGNDTTAAVQAQFPRALSYVYVTNQASTTSNHVRAIKVYMNITADALNTLANA